MNPISMVLINIFSTFVLFSAVLFYTKIWPKRKISGMVLVILFAIPPLISILRPGTYESGDLSLHSTGTLSFYNALIDGSLIPRWGGDLINGFGTPHHMLMYFLPRYMPALIHLLGIPILISLKIYLISTFILSGVGMYLFAKKEFGITSGIVAAIFYLYAPYHLLDLHFRVSVGEILAFAVVPFCFYTLSNFLDRKSTNNFTFFALTITVLILSHMAITSFTIPSLILFSIYKSKKNKLNSLIATTIGIIIGILLSSFYLIPLLLESKYTIYSTFKGLFLPPIQSLLYSPYRYGFLFQGPEGELAFIIGYAQIGILILSLVLLFKKKLSNIGTYATIMTAILIFMITPLSRSIWETIPILRGFESSYRLLLLVSFFISLIAAYLAQLFIHQKKLLIISKLSLQKKLFIVYFLIFIAIFQSILNWGNRRNIETMYKDEYFESLIPTYLLINNGNDYALPIWVDLKNTYYRTERHENISVLKGNATINELERTNTSHQYKILSKTPSTILENTFYFPGWNLYINGDSREINYRNAQYPGAITFTLPPGTHDVHLKFENTVIRSSGNAISIITLLGLILFNVNFYIRKPHKLK